MSRQPSSTKGEGYCPELWLLRPLARSCACRHQRYSTARNPEFHAGLLLQYIGTWWRDKEREKEARKYSHVATQPTDSELFVSPTSRTEAGNRQLSELIVVPCLASYTCEGAYRAFERTITYAISIPVMNYNYFKARYGPSHIGCPASVL